MRKSLKLLSLFLALSMTGSILSACGDNKGDSGDDTNTAETFDYATEMLSKMDNVSTGYNSSLFYVNTLEFQIADPSVIYVTEGEDAGYFYAYGTSDEIAATVFRLGARKTFRIGNVRVSLSCPIIRSLGL